MSVRVVTLPAAAATTPPARSALKIDPARTPAMLWISGMVFVAALAIASMSMLLAPTGTGLGLRPLVTAAGTYGGPGPAPAPPPTTP